MNKLEFMNELGALADKFAFLLQHYTDCHEGYDGRTDADKSITVGQISASIQDGELATISVDIGSVDSKHRIIIDRYPDSENPENNDWRVEDK